MSPVVTYICLLNFAMHRTHLLQMGWVRLRHSLAKGRWYQELIIIPNYLSSCLPVQSLEILSLCLFPGLVWPHLVQLTKAELLYSSATATPRENNQDHLSAGWVAIRTKLCPFKLWFLVKHHKIRTTLAPGCLQIDKGIIISK